MDRRQFLGTTAGLAATAAIPATAQTRAIEPTWAGLAAAYRVPEWFRDAKFGIWAHWSAQCVPEFGDWYGRQMYIQGNPFYDHHVKTYGHPSRVGFMEIENRWRAEAWDPEALIALFKKAGAKYFMALANHHDNLDCYDSAHHRWNTMRVGPKRDIVGTWEKIARAEGLRFGVSNHSAHAWHWWQTAYGYDAEGPLKGRRYDAWRLTKADGRGKWWEGLDPQELYTGGWFVPPAGLDSIEAMNKWHDARDGQWLETAPPGPRGPAYTRNWLLRQMDLVEKYRPDIVYFDNYGLPFDRVGRQAAAHYYEQALRWNGATDVVLTGKRLDDEQRRAIVEDVERGFSDRLRPEPWQTDTCIGNWHYDRALFERHGYKSAKLVVQRLCDAVAKNGNLLLSIPQRGDGSIDSDELTILGDLADWFAVHGDAIYGTRPWRVYGEGPTRPVAGMQNEGEAKPFTPADIRYTVGPAQGGGHAGDRPLYAFLLDWPTGPVRIEGLGRRSVAGGRVERVSLVGGGRLDFDQGDDALQLRLPATPAIPAVPVPCLRIDGRGLV